MIERVPIETLWMTSPSYNNCVMRRMSRGKRRSTKIVTQITSLKSQSHSIISVLNKVARFDLPAVYLKVNLHVGDSWHYDDRYATKNWGGFTAATETKSSTCRIFLCQSQKRANRYANLPTISLTLPKYLLFHFAIRISLIKDNIYKPISMFYVEIFPITDLKMDCRNISPQGFLRQIWIILFILSYTCSLCSYLPDLVAVSMNKLNWHKQFVI